VLDVGDDEWWIDDVGTYDINSLTKEGKRKNTNVIITSYNANLLGYQWCVFNRQVQVHGYDFPSPWCCK